MNQEQNRAELLHAPLGRLIARYGIPGVVSLVMNALYNIVDQIFIGQVVGYHGNAATSVLFPLTVLSLAFSLLMGDGAAAYSSIMQGRGEKDEAEKGVHAAIFSEIVIALLFLILSFAFFHPILDLLGGGDKEVLPYAIRYGRIILIGLPIAMVSTALASIIRADGSPRIAMASMVIGAFLNIFLDWLFMIPIKMGVEGAALATVISQAAGLLVCLFYLPHFRMIRLRWKLFRPDIRRTVKVASLGISSFITQIAFVLVATTNNNLMVLRGEKSIYGAVIPLAAFGICMKVNNILFSVTIGLSAGSQPIIGYNYGAGRMDRVKGTYLRAVLMSMLFMTVGFLIFQLRPMWIIRLFGSEKELYNDFARKCFRIFLMLIILNAFQIGTGIFFQAIGKPVQASLISLSRQILFYIPCAIGLSHYFGIIGVLAAGPVADLMAALVAGVLLIRTLRREPFRKKEGEGAKLDKNTGIG